MPRVKIPDFLSQTNKELMRTEIKSTLTLDEVEKEGDWNISSVERLSAMYRYKAVSMLDSADRSDEESERALLLAEAQVFATLALSCATSDIGNGGAV